MLKPLTSSSEIKPFIPLEKIKNTASALNPEPKKALNLSDTKTDVVDLSPQAKKLLADFKAEATPAPKFEEKPRTARSMFRDSYFQLQMAMRVAYDIAKEATNPKISDAKREELTLSLKKLSAHIDEINSAFLAIAPNAAPNTFSARNAQVSTADLSTAENATASFERIQARLTVIDRTVNFLRNGRMA